MTLNKDSSFVRYNGAKVKGSRMTKMFSEDKAYQRELHNAIDLHASTMPLKRKIPLNLL